MEAYILQKYFHLKILPVTKTLEEQVYFLSSHMPVLYSAVKKGNEIVLEQYQD